MKAWQTFLLASGLWLIAALVAYQAAQGTVSALFLLTSGYLAGVALVMGFCK